jgi:hypothetical protein
MSRAVVQHIESFANGQFRGRTADPERPILVEMRFKSNLNVGGRRGSAAQEGIRALGCNVRDTTSH